MAEQELKDANISSVDEKVWVGGQTATQFDKRDTVKSDEFMIIPIIIVLISLLLLAYLRSVTAMVYLMGTVILSFFAAMGLGWIILHYFMGVDAIEGTIPLYSFVFLVALGEDYNIFMVSSIWRKKETMPIKQAIRKGVAETSGVITSAGIILAATFSVLATLPIQVLVQFGLITALGVLMDTFIVRPFLVPAITSLLGRRAFWPGKVSNQEEKEQAN
jgi:RND superfamily putative drug exporter